MLDQIKSAGFKLLILSGGEPLVRPDIFELASYSHKIGLRPVVGTNGTRLTSETAKRLTDSGVTGVSISLDSSSPSFHNKFRNSPGAWEKAIEGINNSLKAGIRVQVNLTLTESNFDQFEKMVDFVIGLGVQALFPFFLVPTGRGKNIEEEALKQERYFNAIKATLEKQKSAPIELKPTCAPQFMPMGREMGLDMRYTRGCIAGISYCCILPGGDVNICPYLPVKVGNVRKKPFDEIWKESEIFNQLRDFSQYEGRCGKCPEINTCGGCRARAYYYNEGNYMAEEPWCYKYEE